MTTRVRYSILAVPFFSLSSYQHYKGIVRRAQKRVAVAAVNVGAWAAVRADAQVQVNNGLNVLLLEIGAKLDRNVQFYAEHSWAYEMPFRGLGKPGQYEGLWKV